MAEGYARVTGKPGVLLVTSGPGATNTVTPLMDALMDGTPLVVFTGQVVTSAIGTDAFQEADVIGITRHCTKWNTLVKDVQDLPGRIEEAFHIATSGRPGPVLVDLPKDVTASKFKASKQTNKRTSHVTRMKQKQSVFGSSFAQTPSNSDFERVAELIKTARRPIIYAGQGVMWAKNGVELLKELAEKAKIPVTTTLQGLGGFDETSPLSLKMLGMHGSAAANYSMQSADLILAIGARFDDRVDGSVGEVRTRCESSCKRGKGWNRSFRDLSEESQQSRARYGVDDGRSRREPRQASSSC